MSLSKSQLFKNLNINLDLALEAQEVIRGETGQEIPGVKQDIEKYQHAKVTTVTVANEQGAQLVQKPLGNYITIEAPEIRQNNKEVHEEISQVLAKSISKLVTLNDNSTILLVGLGNWNATPDSLGPRVIRYSLVTRHIKTHAPQELQGGLRSVCALSPGVLGLTGIETAEIIKGVVDRVKPDLIIAVDALAAANVERISTTIQIADTGISPGSGVGNQRQGINKETMGVDCLAIGVPTVVHAGVIAHTALEKFFDQLKTSPTLYQIYKGLNPDAVNNIISEVLQPFAGDLMVTPKEIDELIENTGKIIAAGLAMALHPAITHDEVSTYLH